MPYLACDVDGVLVDTDALHFDALNAALHTLQQPILSLAEHRRTFKGRPTRVKLQMLVDADRLVPRLVVAVESLKQSETLRRLHNLPANPRVRAVVNTLRKAGWTLCACSNAIAASSEMMVRAAGVREAMQFVLSNEDVAHPKPAPDIYLAAADRFGILPRDMIVLEDSPIGQEAARAAGCKLVVVDGPEDVHLGLLPRLEAAACG